MVHFQCYACQRIDSKINFNELRQEGVLIGYICKEGIGCKISDNRTKVLSQIPPNTIVMKQSDHGMPVPSAPPPSYSDLRLQTTVSNERLIFRTSLERIPRSSRIGQQYAKVPSSYWNELVDTHNSSNRSVNHKTGLQLRICWFINILLLVCVIIATIEAMTPEECYKAN